MKRDSRPSKRSDSHIQKQLAGIGHVTGGASLVLCRHVARPRANAAHFNLPVGNFAYSSSSTCWQSANKAIQMSFLAGARSVECTAGDRGWLVRRALYVLAALTLHSCMQGVFAPRCCFSSSLMKFPAAAGCVENSVACAFLWG